MITTSLLSSRYHLLFLHQITKSWCLATVLLTTRLSSGNTPHLLKLQSLKASLRLCFVICVVTLPSVKCYNHTKLWKCTLKFLSFSFPNYLSQDMKTESSTWHWVQMVRLWLLSLLMKPFDFGRVLKRMPSRNQSLPTASFNNIFDNYEMLILMHLTNGVGRFKDLKWFPQKFIRNFHWFYCLAFKGLGNSIHKHWGLLRAVSHSCHKLYTKFY